MLCFIWKEQQHFHNVGFQQQLSKFWRKQVFHVNVLEDNVLRENIKEFTQWPTIPQLYVKGEFVGGCDIIREMYENGELQETFEKNNIATMNAA